MTKYQLFEELEKLGITPGQCCAMWPVISRFFARWIIDRPGLLPVQPEDLMRMWQEEAA